MKNCLIASALLAFALPALAVNPNGSISPEILSKIRDSYTESPSDKALRNAIANNSIDQLALSSDNANPVNTHFSHRVKSEGITNQKSSGRCWLFTGLNVLRSQIMGKHGFPKFTLSQNFNYFYDQLEKANLFLQGVIDTADKPMNDPTVDWLFQHPIADGGTFAGVVDIVGKYGIVPTEVMHETVTSESTAKYREIMGLKLREDGIRLRQMAEKGATTQQLIDEKEKMLTDVYRILALTLGQPPTEFQWTQYDRKGNPVQTKTYTPKSFYDEYAGNDLANDYIMLMNDPSRPYWKLYEIDYDRHSYDGHNWTFVNLPIEEIKKMAIESIKDSTMMYISCDVKKFLNRDRGLLDINNYDYSSLFGTEFGMNKAERIKSHASASTHAMTLMAVDLDANDQPIKWMVENSWGNGANDGHLIMTDEWFDEYMFRVVVNKKYAPKKVLEVLKQTPTLLPAWDPLFGADE